MCLWENRREDATQARMGCPRSPRGYARRGSCAGRRWPLLLAMLSGFSCSAEDEPEVVARYEPVESNLPQGTATQRIAEPGSLRVESLTFRQDATYLELLEDDAGYATQWLGVLVNDSSRDLCPGPVELRMRRSDGTPHLE